VYSNLAITYASLLQEAHVPYGSRSVTYHPAEMRSLPLPPADAGTRFSDPEVMQG